MATTYDSAPVAHTVCRLQAVRKLLTGTRLSALQNKHVLPGSCIDLDNPCVDDSGGKTIVNPDGSDSSYLEQILSILGELVAGKETTGQFIATALCLDLVAPIMFGIVLDDGTPLQVEGLYSLDEEKFKQLDELQIARLRQTRHG